MAWWVIYPNSINSRFWWSTSAGALEFWWSKVELVEVFEYFFHGVESNLVEESAPKHNSSKSSLFLFPILVNLKKGKKNTIQ